MEQFYKDARTPLRMREGPLGAYVDDLARQLDEEGYARASVRCALQLVADLGRWMARRKIVATQLIPERLDRLPLPGSKESLLARLMKPKYSGSIKMTRISSNVGWT